MTDPYCTCFDTVKEVTFHTDQQDTTCVAWQKLLTLIDEAATDGRTEFAPFQFMTPEERFQIVTLPPSIAQLTAVKDFELYRSNLVRIPPEIGAMTSLEVFVPYTSYRLHWSPYEITRCLNLRDSRVSTRALYGSEEYRYPFPALSATTIGVGDAFGPGIGPGWHACSICDRVVPRTEIHQVWISRWVGTDVLPLLVHACSIACIQALPPAADGYIPGPHQGGMDLQQPPTRWEIWEQQRQREFPDG